MNPRTTGWLSRVLVYFGCVGVLLWALHAAAAAPGLVALWHGDGDAQDAVGGNHGTLMGGIGFTTGVAGQAFLLDGNNDYVRVPDAPSLHLSNELTLEMWFKREDSASYGALIDKRNWTSCNFGVIMSPDWGFQLYYNDPSVADGNQFEISFSPVPSAGVFHHLAGTFRQVDAGNVELKTYVDGQLVQTDTRRGNLANTFNGDVLSIGTPRDGLGGAFFRGAIDEVALYSRALSLSEIQSNYTALATNVPPPPPPPPPSTNQGTLVALWHADGDAQDAVGGNHGTLMGGIGFAPGISGQGFLLDGVNDYVRIPDNVTLHLSNELTLEMWFQREDASSYGILIDKRTYSSCNFGVIMSVDWGFQLYYDDPNVNDGNQFEISFSTVPSPGAFHHLAGTYRQIDWGHVEMKTYIDGQLVRTDTRRGNLANTFNGTPVTLGVGRDGLGGSFFRGIIDEVALYSRALTASEIESNYTALATNLPPPPPPPPPSTNTGGLVSLWLADGNAEDSVGVNDGALVNGATFTQGVFGQGFLLDGANDFIRIPDNPTLHLADEVTVELWFKRQDASSYGTLFDKRNWTSCNYGIIMSADWGFQLYYNDPAVYDGNMFEISFSGVPSAGIFHHFAGTFRQVDPAHVELKTYIDGQIVRSDILGGNLANTFNGDALAIGSARDGSDAFFRGVIDEVALYNRALTASEIISNYTRVARFPQILAQPQSVTAVAGEDAEFTVLAVAEGQLVYQWRFQGNDISGATNSSLLLSMVSQTNAGGYSVVVTNAFGSVTSSVATLTVSSSGLPPSFTTAPFPAYTAPEGANVTMNASVAGTPPFAYQWTFDGVPIPAATNRSLMLSAVQPANAGTYRLHVTNDYGAIVSAGSVLTVTTITNGGTIYFSNFSYNHVHETDGTTAVPPGGGFVASLSVGTETNALVPLPGNAVFILPGRFLGGTRIIPELSAGQTVQAQVRVWDSSVSASYEEAVALGARHGASAVFQITVGGSIMPPGLLDNMLSFSLEPGIAPKRRVVRPSGIPTSLRNVVRSGNETTFVLSGAAGVTYAIEMSADLVNWTVLDYVINNSGAVTVSDTAPVGESRRFYRARAINP